MEEIFKQNLLRLRETPKPQNFSEALFPQGGWKGRVVLETRPGKASAEGSEKVQVLESLEAFATQQDTPLIQFPGGEIEVRVAPEFSMPKEFQDILFQGKKTSDVKALFVTETFRPWDEVKKDLKSGFINELLTGFPMKTAELFERMILAMKLSASEVLLYPVEFEGQDCSQEVMNVAAHFQPEVIITLGAKATQKILKSNDRLSLIHGQFFSRKVEKQATEFQVIPLFHPSIIETNQNMKKTAWADMQKIMKHLKKLT